MNKEALIPLVKKFATEIKQQMQDIKNLEDRLKKTDDNLYWYETEYKKLQNNYDNVFDNAKKMDSLIKRFKSTLLLRDELLKDVYVELEQLRSKSIPFGGKLEKTLINISKVTKEKEPDVITLTTPQISSEKQPQSINSIKQNYTSTTRLLDIIG